MITVPSWIFTARDMRIIRSMKSTDSAITGAGGRSSGRETIGRVAAGAIAAKLLESLGVTVTAYARSIGPVEISMDRFDLEAASENKVCMPDREAAKEAESYLEQMLEDQDSVGGVVECVITGLPAGIGEPVFEKLDARLAHAEMSVGAVKGVEIGDGFEAAKAVGSVNNDDFCRNAGWDHRKAHQSFRWNLRRYE